MGDSVTSATEVFGCQARLPGNLAQTGEESGYRRPKIRDFRSHSPCREVWPWKSNPKVSGIVHRFGRWETLFFVKDFGVSGHVFGLVSGRLQTCQLEAS
jgi:hypothetical protein